MYRKMALVIIVAAGLLALPLFAGDANAGQFKRLVGTIADFGGQIVAHASPLNTSTAMEMDVYEFTTPAADSYRCRIIGNTTGQDLTVRLIGLTGSPLASCTTPVNGPCDTPYTALGGGFLFQCTVSSGAGSPVAAGAHYVITVQRQ